MRKLKIVYKPIDELIPYVNNANIHPQNQIDKIKASIAEFGMNTNIGIHNGIIVYGHGRIEALKQLGETEVPTVDLSHMTKPQMKAYILADNRIQKDSETDIELLKIELSELDELDFDLSLTGFDDDELSEYLKEDIDPQSDEDAVPDLPVVPVSKEGDIWLLGNHRVMCGDSTSIDAVDILLNGCSIDMVHTDPPYGIGEKGDRSKRKGENSLADGVKYEDFKDDTIQYAVDAFNLCEGLKIPRQVWWGANYYSHHVPQTNNWFVWDKRVEDKQKDLNSDCELAYVKSKWASVRIFRHLWKGMMKDSERGQARVHPTQKPIALVEWCIDYYKDVKTILDLFGGSGATLMAAEKKGCYSYIMELSPHYVDVIIKRWQEYTGKEGILESTNETFNSLGGGK